MAQEGVNISEKEFSRLACFIKQHFGINLVQEKKLLVVSRLQNFLIRNNFKSFSEYFDYVVADRTGNAVVTLLNKLTTNHTFFMREADHFDFFRNKVLPYLSQKVKDKDLRIWSAGCSTGQESYTLSMIIDEYFGAEKKLWNTKVLATDISTIVLEKAKKGEYSDEEICMIPRHRRFSYFIKNDNQRYCIVNEIKKEVIYRRFNLMDEVFPFKKKFQVIFCRNVMIYFDRKTKQELVNKFYDFTEPGGYLFIGHSESLNQIETGFRYIRPAIYRKA
ncbi:MCP methyltransferase, CheR-type [Desulfofarcimen acetoxidans DSM 771]|jgi:chemotaxis protein methyltransferase CheR|uniref:protein-glutamate O-methyltransferase n=1 Tax=Desulfofarcimen acetoxidans (strain ATCC 49208 / DSM 771 / KCTC 5769 / VKM B-1644 / 5575) TaxID=485916 RepID=C8W0W5_DESAS|nr:protein-glutamate O-methyltransferase CheR [Desulfofarcimen acetoxidans]ACV61534.1 MCP methyltransferase, CheR-type [Desulfofarcimen acetoxidans DSM 771]